MAGRRIHPPRSRSRADRPIGLRRRRADADSGFHVGGHKTRRTLSSLACDLSHVCSWFLPFIFDLVPRGAAGLLQHLNNVLVVQGLRSLLSCVWNKGDSIRLLHCYLNSVVNGSGSGAQMEQTKQWIGAAIDRPKIGQEGKRSWLATCMSVRTWPRSRSGS